MNTDQQAIFLRDLKRKFYVYSDKLGNPLTDTQWTVLAQMCLEHVKPMINENSRVDQLEDDLASAEDDCQAAESIVMELEDEILGLQDQVNTLKYEQDKIQVDAFREGLHLFCVCLGGIVWAWFSFFV